MTLIPPVCPPPHAVLEPPYRQHKGGNPPPLPIPYTHAYTHIYTYIYSSLFFLIPIYHKPYATADRFPPHYKERD